jgi:hypothetical protein
MLAISTFRMYLLRAGYLIIAVGLAIMIWPGIINPPDSLPHMNEVVRSILGAVSLLALLGILYPLKMLPILFFELLWKLIWLVAFGIRLWSLQRLSAEAAETAANCLFGIALVIIVVPWGYVLKNYIRLSEERFG